MYYNSRKVKKEIKWKGIVIASAMALICILTFFGFMQPLTNIILGVFGIMFYPLAILTILLSLGFALNLRFSMTKKNVIYLVAVALCLNLLLHTAFVAKYAKVSGMSFSNYFSFLGDVVTFKSGLTVGGVLTSIISYPFMCILSPVGACIVFAIALIISGGITLDYYINIKSTEYNKMARATHTRDGLNEDNLNFSENIGPVSLITETDKVVQRNIKEEQEIFNDEPEEDDELQGEVINFNNNQQYSNEVDLVNDEKANSHYDPSKFSSVEEYIKYPYVPPIFKSNKTNDSTQDFQVEDESDLEDDDFEEDDEDDDDIFNDAEDEEEESNSLWASNMLQEESNLNSNTSDFGGIFNSQEQESSRARGRERSAFDNNPFNPFTPSENLRTERTRRDEETFTSPANNFFASTPKSEPEQLTVGLSKPKTYKQEKDRKYSPPPTTLLQLRSDDESGYGGDYEKKSIALEEVLSSFNIDAKVTNVVRGPAVTQYELSMPYGTSVKRVLNYDSDISAALMSRSGVRIEAPIPGKNAVGVEVANDKRSTVGLREMLESKEFQNSSANLPIVIGKGISGEVVVKSLPKLVHMLVAGSTGSGKSIFLHSVILSLMFKCSPTQLRFIMIDPKRVEFTGYSGMPHMMLPNAVCECDKAINALGWAVKEMDRRFKKLQKFQVQNIQDFNHCSAVTETHEEEPMPYLVLVIDELADLMMVGKKEVEEKIARLAQLGRASGIHMMIATQRPSADIITGTIKNNLPTRVAFSLGSSIDSRVILDETGAEKLLGAGDMLLSASDSNATIRLQGGFMSMDEVRKVVEYIKEHNDTCFDEELEKEILSDKSDGSTVVGGSDDGSDRPKIDDLLPKALKLCIESGGASTNMVQRRFSVGYARASRIIDQMELAGYVSKSNGSKLRTVNMTMSEFREKFGDDI